MRKLNATKEDVFDWLKRATFKKIKYGRHSVSQVFSMPDDNPFTADYDDGGGPYRLEHVRIKYIFHVRRRDVTFRPELSLDMNQALRRTPGSQEGQFDNECLRILFEKSPRLDDRVVEQHLRKVARSDLKSAIKSRVEQHGLSREDVELAFHEYLVEEVMDS